MELHTIQTHTNKIRNLRHSGHLNILVLDRRILTTKSNIESRNRTSRVLAEQNPSVSPITHTPLSLILGGRGARMWRWQTSGCRNQAAAAQSLLVSFSMQYATSRHID